METLDRYKAVIPDVYSRVKDQSDTFFIKQALGTNYNTQNVRLSEESPKFTSLQPKLFDQSESRAPTQMFGSGHDMQIELGTDAP